VRDPSGPYANCFDEVAGSGTRGLKTAITITPYPGIVCAGRPVMVTGRLFVQDLDGYGPLGNNNLAGRPVAIDGLSPPSLRTTTATSGSNWSITLSAANLTIRYSAHFEAPTSEGLDSSPGVAVSIRWLSRQVPCDDR